MLARAEAILLRRLQHNGRIVDPRQAERFLRPRLIGRLHEELQAGWLNGHHRIIDGDLPAGESRLSSHQG